MITVMPNLMSRDSWIQGESLDLEMRLSVWSLPSRRKWVTTACKSISSVRCWPGAAVKTMGFRSALKTALRC